MALLFCSCHLGFVFGTTVAELNDLHFQSPFQFQPATAVSDVDILFFWSVRSNFLFSSPIVPQLPNNCRDAKHQGADYGYGYSDSPRNGGGGGGGGDYGGVWSSAPSHGIDEYG